MSYCLNPTCAKPYTNTDKDRFCSHCGTKLLLQQRYRALKLIGSGGFGRTFLALDTIEHPVSHCVLKQFYPQGSNRSPKAAQLFQQEAVRLKSLGNYPKIPQFLGYFVEDSCPYIIQEFIDGFNLDDELNQLGYFNEEQVRACLQEILEILVFIHQAKVIHRDIKPENILRRRLDRQLFLVDFGAAKYASESALKRTGTRIGSVGYAAPEQNFGRGNYTSDLYSLGVTCIHLLTGIHPIELYSDRDGKWVWREHLKSPISQQLGQILEKMLARAIRDRYPSATAILEALKTNYIPPLTPSLNPSERTLTGHTNAILTVAFSPDGKILASGSRDRTVNLWSLNLPGGLHPLIAHTQAVTTIQFNPQQPLLATGSLDQTIKIWNLAQGKLLETLKQSRGITSLIFTPNGRQLWHSNTEGKIETKQPGSATLNHGSPWVKVFTIAINPQGTILASGGSDRYIHLWHLQTCQKILTLKNHKGAIYALAFSPDGKLLASSSSDRTVKLWEVATGQEIYTFTRHHQLVTSLIFSHNSQNLITGSEDNTIKITEIATKTEIAILRSHHQPIRSIALSPDGQTLASGSDDKTVKLWNLV